MSEAELQRQVIKLARLRGFLVFHPAISQFSEPGFPDLCMVRPDRFLIRELKSAKGRITEPQARWILTLSEAGVDAGYWRPEDLKSGRIEAELAPAWMSAA